MCFKIIHGEANIDVHEFFQFCDHGLQRNRHTQSLVLPKTRLDCMKFSFGSRVVKPWNSLSQSAVDSPTCGIFKTRLKGADFSKFLIYR